ncbi:MAG: hypothetical protein V5A60_05920, partial [Haloarculaceae archaeon]
DGNRSIHLGGEDARLSLGAAGGNDGDVFVHDHDGNRSIHLGGEDARLSLGAAGGNDGDVFVHDHDGNRSIHLGGEDARLSLGAAGGNDGDVFVHDSDGNRTIHLGGDSGDIVLSNADAAEDFEIVDDERDLAVPGTVMIIDERGALRIARDAYDSRVAGVVSGAGDLQPGLVLGRGEDRSRDSHQPVALDGRVNCKIDSSHGAIEVGDLLTTSETPGYAMRAEDPEQAFGAVIGKALESHERGTGTVPILVALQ